MEEMCKKIYGEQNYLLTEQKIKYNLNIDTAESENIIEYIKRYRREKLENANQK